MVMQQNKDYAEAQFGCLPISVYVPNFVITVECLGSMVATNQEYRSHTT